MVGILASGGVHAATHVWVSGWSADRHANSTRERQHSLRLGVFVAFGLCQGKIRNPMHEKEKQTERARERERGRERERRRTQRRTHSFELNHILREKEINFQK